MNQGRRGCPLAEGDDHLCVPMRTSDCRVALGGYCSGKQSPTHVGFTLVSDENLPFNPYECSRVFMNKPPEDPLMRHIWQDPPKVLYHYTGIDVLEKLTNKDVGNGKLWASDIRFLNDRSEYIEARHFIKELLKE